MASKSVTLSSSAYTKLDTGSATALLVQNNTTYPVGVIFAASAPALDAGGRFVVQPGQGLARDSMTSDMYAIIAVPSAAFTSGNEPSVIVGE